jgi:hypothetical protein
MASAKSRSWSDENQEQLTNWNNKFEILLLLFFLFLTKYVECVLIGAEVRVKCWDLFVNLTLNDNVWASFVAVYYFTEEIQTFNMMCLLHSHSV